MALACLVFSNAAPAQTSPGLPAFLHDQGAVKIGELKFQFKPGWWQYYPSCEPNKWISFSQKFEPRGDYRASCEQQIHDWESEVAPTLSKTAEFVLPQSGKVFAFADIKQAEGYEPEPKVHVVLLRSDGSTQDIWAYSTSTPPKPERFKPHDSTQGDKVTVKLAARLRNVVPRRVFYKFDATVSVYSIPSAGVKPAPSKDTSCNKANIEVLKKQLAQSEPGYYVLCAQGGDEEWNLDVEIDATGRGDFQEYAGQPVPLTRDAKIITGPGSEALIVYKSKKGSIRVEIKVSALSHLKLERYLMSEEGITADTNLEVGKIDVKVDRRYEAIDFSVSTPTCTVSVRGTHFTVKHERNPDTTTINVKEGEVEVTPTACPEPPFVLSRTDSATLGDCPSQTDRAHALLCADDTAFIRSLYKACFEREPSETEIKNQVRRLRNGTTRSQMVRFLFHSTEYGDKNKGSDQIYADLSQAILGHHPLPSEQKNVPESLMSRELEKMLAGPEHMRRTNNCENLWRKKASKPAAFFENFSSGLAHVSVDDPQARVENGTLRWKTANFRNATFGWELPIENVAIEFDGYVVRNGFNVYLRNERNLGYELILGGWNNRQSGSQYGKKGAHRKLVNGKVWTPKQWHHYKIIRKGDNLSAYCDGEIIFQRNITQHFEGPAKLWFNSYNSPVGLGNVKVYKIQNEVSGNTIQ